MVLKQDMDTTEPTQSLPPKKRKFNLALSLSIFVMLVGIGIGLYILNVPQIFKSLAATGDTFSKCKPGHCNDYGWKDNKGYTKVPNKCYIALYKCKVNQWDKAIAVGCQKSTKSSKNTAYYAEIHNKSGTIPAGSPIDWDKAVGGTDGNGHLKAFAPPQMCGIWQIDVGPPCTSTFHSGGDRRPAVCKNEPEPEQEFHNVCDNMACKKVKGKGNNECAEAGKNPAPQCSQRKCENKKCVVVAGRGENKCKTDSDCLKSPTPTTPPDQCLGLPVVTDVKIDCPLCGDIGD